VIKDEEGTVLFKKGMLLDGEATVQECEYSGLIFGLFNAHKLGATEVDVRMDSQLVVNQINHKFACRQAHLKDYLREVRKEIKKFAKVTVSWVPREENQHADQIARALLDG
jgi:ribonuclease HI